VVFTLHYCFYFSPGLWLETLSWDYRKPFELLSLV
jgi:hypothetical protein